MNINESINEILKNMMHEYSLKISEECNIKQEKLHDIWNDLCNDFKLDKKHNIKKKSPPKKKTILNNKCKAILQRGKRAGEECGKKCEHNFCKVHVKHIVEEISQEEKVKEDKIPEKIVIRKNKQLDKFWHPRTRFIFKSSKELVVVGKITDTDTFVDLEDSDIEICQRWKFKYEYKEGLKS
tara:strand:+ start:97 stop:642 length:546 start_codon:yes stop_codon:yes gene_type:complete